jgi:hypothetical protein
MHKPPPQLLSEILNFIHLIPKGYRWPLLGVALLVVGLIATIIMVSESRPLPPLKPVEVALEDPISPATGDAVTDLFDPSTGQTRAQQHEAAVLAQVDNILLNSFILSRCRRLNAEEYQDTYQMLVNYTLANRLAPDLTAAEAIVRERANAATATYQMVYARLTCGDLDTKGLADVLARWRANARLSHVKLVDPKLSAPASPPSTSPAGSGLPQSAQ